MKPSKTDNQTKAAITLRYRGMNPRSIWQRIVESQIEKLHHLASIACATVTLECNHRKKPAFRVCAKLEVPGPDFHAEATGYTLHAALLQVLNNLKRQIQSRHNRRLDRRRVTWQSGVPSGRFLTLRTISNPARL